jgi:ABC-type Zn2+ transport system substrate-binding protein/surface adhesin
MFNKLMLIIVFTIVVSLCSSGFDTAASNVFAGKNKDSHHEKKHDDDHHKKEKAHSDKHKPADMTKLVRKAKNELLIEKIKAKLEIRMGDKLDKVADLLIDEMLEKYKAREKDGKRRKELEEGLKNIFSQGE